MLRVVVKPPNIASHEIVSNPHINCADDRAVSVRVDKPLASMPASVSLLA
jgi:hypothetical protein